MSIPRVLATATLALSLAACGAVVPPPSSTSPGTATAAGGGSPMVLGDADSGRSVSVAVGATVTVVLSSTYWQVQGSSNTSVLRLQAPPVVSPAPRGQCVAGGGCGAVTAVFTAAAAGTATLTATRTTCGEALVCSAANGRYAVTVAVVSS